MDRKDLLRHPFDKKAKLIEIGASYNPIIPKSEGWNTVIIDHADQKTLRQKYAGETAERIESVDYVWTTGGLDDLIPVSKHGTFDGLIASHVGEHMPDLIGFLLAMDRVLAPHAIIALALPDLRSCFDFFRPRSTTGDLLDARGRVRHRRGKIFDNLAYYCNRNGMGGWTYGLSPEQGGPFTLANRLQDAWQQYQAISEESSDPYHDTHGWCFTPSSFHLNIVELHAMDVIPWSVSRLDQSGGIEFYVWLERRRMKPVDLEDLRLRLLTETINEAAEQLTQLKSLSSRPRMVEPGVKSSIPTVAAIVPLYNGAAFIERALNSILTQTVRPRELFVIDDGSTDNGSEVVREYMSRVDLHDIDFHLLHKDNGGQSSARNLGAASATSDLLAFLDQDDEWYPQHIEKLQIPFIDQPPGPPLGWAYSNLDHADVSGRVLHRNWLPSNEHPKRDLFSCISRDMFVLPSASLISRAAFNEVGGFDIELSGYEDDDLFSRMFQLYSNIFINEPLSKWCIHHTSSSYSYRMRRSRDRYCQKLLAAFPDNPQQSIFYARDLILPRFYPQALSELQAALQSGDYSRIAETHQGLRHLLHHASRRGIHNIMSASKARRLSRLLKIITPEYAPYFYNVRRVMRPLARRVLL
jgi:glycosyltransferase involved in cell wall biosynthesis